MPRRGHAPQPAMWRADEEWAPLPVAHDAERPLPVARRNVAGRTKGQYECPHPQHQPLYPFLEINDVRGRRPKPTRLKVLTGNLRKTPLNMHEPEPAPSLSECPPEPGPVA